VSKTQAQLREENILFVVILKAAEEKSRLWIGIKTLRIRKTAYKTAIAFPICINMYRITNYISSFLQVAPVDSALALYQNVMDSPHRNYFLTSGMIFILVIFFFGLCFGRVTKRVRSELKNR
jgi:hypothetical protein